MPLPLVCLRPVGLAGHHAGAGLRAAAGKRARAGEQDRGGKVCVVGGLGSVEMSTETLQEGRK